MAKHLRLNAFANSAPNIDGLEWQHYSSRLEETDSFEDIFNPMWWRHHASGGKALRELDKVRLIAHDESFDIDVTISQVVPGGLKVRLLSGMLPLKYHGMHSSEIASMFTKDPADFEVCKLDHNGKPVPRVELLGVGWRVISNDAEVVEEKIKSKTAADHRLDRYLNDMGLRFPTPAEAHAHVEAIRQRDEDAAKATARKSPSPGRPPKAEAA